MAKADERVSLERRPEVQQRTGLSCTAIYAAMRRGEFPEPVKIGRTAVAWRSNEVDRWIETRERASGVKGEAQ